jgi:hypothetical protein
MAGFGDHDHILNPDPTEVLSVKSGFHSERVSFDKSDSLGIEQGWFVDL